MHDSMLSAFDVKQYESLLDSAVELPNLFVGKLNANRIAECDLIQQTD